MSRFDFHIQLVDPTDQRVRGATFAFGLGTALAVRGPQKLVNRWTKQFLTTRGTSPLHRKDGTLFPNLIGGNADAGDAEAVVLVAIEECNERIREIDARSPWLTADERLADATLLQYDAVRPDAAEFWVRITTRSGARVPALIPYARL